MRKKEVSYERLKKRTEPFENERVGVVIELEEDEDEDEAMEEAKRFVAKHLGEGLKIQDAQERLQELADLGLSQEALAKVAAEFQDLTTRTNPRQLFPSIAVSEDDRGQ